MVDPKRVLALLSQQQAAQKKKRACADPKAVLFKIRKAQLRQAVLDGAVVADPPFERRQV